MGTDSVDVNNIAYVREKHVIPGALVNTHIMLLA